MTNLDNIVFKVSCGSQTGTAFLISKNRAITVFHVIAEHEQYDIIIFDGTNEKCKAKLSNKVNTQYKKLDVALLELELPIICESAIELVDFESIPKGTKWCSRGFPASKNCSGDNILEKDNNVVNQQFSFVRNDKIDIQLEHDQKLSSYQGYSGAPLLIDGAIAGIINTELVEQGNSKELNALSIKHFKALLVGENNNKVQTKVKPTPRPYEKAVNREFVFVGSTVWTPVIFGQARDLGPALMGRSLGPADVVACPKLIEADTAIAELKHAFTARIVGEPGVGKTMCAYQAAKHFADLGWQVVRIVNPQVNNINLHIADTDDPILFLIDDAHLTSSSVLRIAEEQATSNRLLLSTHNAVECDSSFRHSIIIDATRAVRTIAAALKSTPKRTLEVVNRIDDQVGFTPHSTSIEDRIADAQEDAKFPWQFCFILGGGWRRAAVMASAAKAANADILLAVVAIHQIASRDKNPTLDELAKLIEPACLNERDVAKGIKWLVKERLLLSSTDLRCPHQRYAVVVLKKIIEGQSTEGKGEVGFALQSIMMDESMPIAGLRLLLHELKFSGDFSRWTYLIPESALISVIDRCWAAKSADERTYACLILGELDKYIKGWPEVIFVGRESIIGSWISAPLEPVGYGLSHLISSVSNVNKELACTLVTSANSCAVAESISNANPKTAFHLGKLLAAIGVAAQDPWFEIFKTNLNPNKLVELAVNWPLDGRVGAFAEICQSVMWIDENLTLDMVEQFLPTAQHFLNKDPINAFRGLNEIAWHVLRVLDPLGIYVGELKPQKRQRMLAAKMVRAINASVLADQLSESRIRQFQATSFLLSFMAKAVPAKFRSTIAKINWDKIAKNVGEDWANLSHDTLVLFSVAYSAVPSREMLEALVNSNLHRIELFPPRLVVISPSAALKHVEQGGKIRLSQYGHVDWTFGAFALAFFAEEKPELLSGILAPSEIPTGLVLSNSHRSWYKEAATYIEILIDVAPESLQRILDAVETDGAEKGWESALKHGGGYRKTVAFLVESSINRTDQLGEVANNLRRRFPKSSIPKKTEMD